jgi:uncharacterized membrane protein (UPF0127 family)
VSLRRTRHWPALAAGLAALAGTAPVWGDAARAALDALPRERIALETRGSGRHEFRAWRADTPETRARGLMYVADLASDEAMIFVYEEPQVLRMWMKDTYLPLDMLFVDEHGCIVNIAERTTPLSLATIESGTPAVLVVELKGGVASAAGARVGDRVWRPEVAPPRNGPCAGSSAKKADTPRSGTAP